MCVNVNPLLNTATRLFSPSQILFAQKLIEIVDGVKDINVKRNNSGTEGQVLHGLIHAGN